MSKGGRGMALATATQRVTDTLARMHWSQDEVDALKAKLIALSNATVIVRSTERLPGGGIKYEERPDNGIQLAATVKALEFAVGKAAQKLEVTTNGQGQAPGVTSFKAMLAANPKLAESVLGALKESLVSSQAIPVEAVASDSATRPQESES